MVFVYGCFLSPKIINVHILDQVKLIIVILLKHVVIPWYKDGNTMALKYIMTLNSCHIHIILYS